MIGALLKLKRYEQPSEAYFEDFLHEFQARRREELMQRSSLSLMFERCGTWLRELGGVRWAYAAGAAYAILMVGLFTWPHGEERAMVPASPVGHELPLAPAVDDQNALDLRGAAGDELPEREF